jgi:hypothetical protein
MPTDTERPTPPPAPDGFVQVPRQEGSDWRLETNRQCRQMEGHHHRCPNQAVAALNRGRRRHGKGSADSWWAYCADHLFGRWIEDGRVMCWILVPAETPAAGSSSVQGEEQT